MPIRFRKIGLVCILIILFLSNPDHTFALQDKELSIKTEAVEGFSFDPLSEYISLGVRLLKEPEGLTANESFMKEWFVNYKKNGLAYVKITNVEEYISFTKKIFEYTKTGTNRWDVKTGTGRITEDMIIPVDGTIEIELYISHTDSESNYDNIKETVGFFADLTYPMATPIVNFVIDTIRKADRETIHYTSKLTLDKERMEKIKTVTFFDPKKKENPLIEIEFVKKEGLLQRVRGDISELFNTAKYKGTVFKQEKNWEQKAIEITKSIMDSRDLGGKQRLIDFYTIFATHLKYLPLTKLDKQMYLTAAICTWSRDFVQTGFRKNNATYKFERQHYGQIPMNLLARFNEKRIMTWLPCNFVARGPSLTDETSIMHAFVVGTYSDNEELKREIADAHIKNKFVLQTGEGKINVYPEDYIDKFRITANAKFDKQKPIYCGNKMFYTFKFTDLLIEFDNKKSEGLPIDIILVKDHEKYYISQITVREKE